jgi:hypothetical protein
MVPTAVGRGQGFEFRAPMAIAVIGGVITSTFLTLLVVPVVFAFFEKLRFGRAPVKAAKSEVREDAAPSGEPVAGEEAVASEETGGKGSAAVHP